MNADQIALNILGTLMSQRFSDWYQYGNFDNFISGGENPPTRDEILEEIKGMFRLNDKDK